MRLDFSKINVLLIGDFMIDSYVNGNSTRQSPEAPVPVIKEHKIDLIPGGAGNVAMNLKSLGANVSCLGYIGNDLPGEVLKKIFNEKGIDHKHLQIEKILTTVKKRFLSNGKQILRIDYEEILDNWKPRSISELEIKNFDIIILSDYNDKALTHWSLTAIKLISYDKMEAIFSTDLEDGECLCIRDSEMIDALRLFISSEEKTTQTNKIGLYLFVCSLTILSIILVSTLVLINYQMRLK